MWHFAVFSVNNGKTCPFSIFDIGVSTKLHTAPGFEETIHPLLLSLAFSPLRPPPSSQEGERF